MKYIVLTGGIASGKSSVGKIALEHGFELIDADKTAHEILDKKADKIAEIFGDEFIEDGRVQRKKLGALVFNDKKKMEALERILHDDIYKAIEQKATQFKKQNKLFIVDIPLFFEKKGVYKSALCAVVYTPKNEQIKRMMQRDRLSKEEAETRLVAQIDIEQKKAMADIVIDNSKDLAHLQKEVEKFINFLKEKYASKQI
ncbi:MAG: dephospho-CoA kinase [Campylobacteraceae bacterium]|jgi:dephospho-CoA kinase|nr:dephospho-CoA kinase [Campylobacteraceae bacterium]